MSDLVRGRPIWFGVKDAPRRAWTSSSSGWGPGKARVFEWLSSWKPFRTSTKAHAPEASILFDKFHVLRHLGEALDSVRKSERAIDREAPPFPKGQKYTLLSNRENLTLEGRRSLKLLLAANKRIHTAYLLKESLRTALGLHPGGLGPALLRELAQLARSGVQALREGQDEVERRDGIAAHCRTENKVALGFVEGLNNKIRVI